MSDMRKIAIRLRGGAHARAGGLMSVVGENPLLAAVAGIGFSVSFQTIAGLAHAHGLPGPSVLYPVGIDVGILALIAEGLWLIREGRSDLVPRVLAWVLAGFTIFVNVHGSRPGDRVGEALHAVMPGLWVVCAELVRHRRVAARRRADGIPSGRWVAAPWPTLTLWVRMRRDGMTSYPLALELEQARWFARDLIRATPEQYRPPRSSLVCKRIRSGRLREDVRNAVAASLGESGPGWEQAVSDWVTDAIGLSERLAASLENSRRDMTRAALEATPAAVPEMVPGQPSVPVPVMPEPEPAPVSEAHPKARTKPAAKPALKLTAAKSRSMPPEQLAEHVSAMLGEYGDVSLNRVKDDLHVGTEKARQALGIARREMRHGTVVPMERRA